MALLVCIPSLLTNEFMFLTSIRNDECDCDRNGA